MTPTNETPDSGTRREGEKIEPVIQGLPAIQIRLRQLANDLWVHGVESVKAGDPDILRQAADCIDGWGKTQWSLDETHRQRDEAWASLAAKDEEIARLKIALADAIRRPMGVIPDDEMNEAERRRVEAYETIRELEKDHGPDGYPAIRMKTCSALADTIDAMREAMDETEDDERIRDQMARRLTDTANALKGNPAPLHLHDWSDLPDVAAKIVDERNELKATLSRIRKHAGQALNDLDSHDPIKACAAELTLAMIADEKMIPLEDGKWKEAALSPTPPAPNDEADLLDLMRDEFARIKNIVPDNAEVVGLCDRAVTTITQNVPVIKQLDDARSVIARQRDRIDCDAIEIGGLYKEIAELKANDDGLAKLLREIEWPVFYIDDEQNEQRGCAVCEGTKRHGHRDYCSLAWWIAKVDGR